MVNSEIQKHQLLIPNCVDIWHLYYARHQQLCRRFCASWVKSWIGKKLRLLNWIFCFWKIFRRKIIKPNNLRMSQDEWNTEMTALMLPGINKIKVIIEIEYQFYFSHQEQCRRKIRILAPDSEKHWKKCTIIRNPFLRSQLLPDLSVVAMQNY